MRCVIPAGLGLLALSFGACPEPTTPPDDAVSDISVDSDAVVVQCTSDEECGSAAKGACQTARCDLAVKVCVVSDVADGTPCAGGDACVIGEACLAGQCAGGSPRPPCLEVECGQDSCGNVCATCSAGESCAAGQCVPEPCAGGVEFAGCCAGDGLLRYCLDGQLQELVCDSASSAGGVCGWSSAGNYYDCVQQGASDPSGDVPYLCPGSSCGPDPCGLRQCGAACGTACGDCDTSSYCSSDGLCVPCSCEGKTCGTDGCGNSCGSCEPGVACVEDTCTDECGSITSKGCCQDDTLTFCENGALLEVDCSESGGCGYFVQNAKFECGFGGFDDPTGLHPTPCDDAEAEPQPDTVEHAEGAEIGDTNDGETVDASDGEATDTGLGPDAPTDDTDTAGGADSDAAAGDTDATGGADSGAAAGDTDATGGADSDAAAGDTDATGGADSDAATTDSGDSSVGAGDSTPVDSGDSDPAH